MSRVTHFELAYLILLVGIAITSFASHELWESIVRIIAIQAALAMALTAPRSRR